MGNTWLKLINYLPNSWSDVDRDKYEFPFGWRDSDLIHNFENQYEYDLLSIAVVFNRLWSSQFIDYYQLYIFIRLFIRITSPTHRWDQSKYKFKSIDRICSMLRYLIYLLLEMKIHIIKERNPTENIIWNQNYSTYQQTVNRFMQQITKSIHLITKRRNQQLWFCIFVLNDTNRLFVYWVNKQYQKNMWGVN